MKNIKALFIGIILLTGFSGCKNESSTDSINAEVLAELVESKTVLIKPEGWDDEYWNSVNKNVDRKKIFNIIVNAVLSGKQKAYNILTDEELTIDNVKEILKNIQLNELGEEVSQKIIPEDLSMIRMREKWSFDEKTFKLNKQVTRIDLLLKKLDQTGVYIGDKALFYVNLDPK